MTESQQGSQRTRSSVGCAGLVREDKTVEGTHEEYGRMRGKGKDGIAAGKEYRRLGRRSENRVDECILEVERKWWERQKELVYSGSPHEPVPITPKLDLLPS